MVHLDLESGSWGEFADRERTESGFLEMVLGVGWGGGQTANSLLLRTTWYQGSTEVIYGLCPPRIPPFLRLLCGLIEALLGSGFVIGHNYWQTAVVVQAGFCWGR